MRRRVPIENDPTFRFSNDLAIDNHYGTISLVPQLAGAITQFECTSDKDFILITPDISLSLLRTGWIAGNCLTDNTG